MGKEHIGKKVGMLHPGFRIMGGWARQRAIEDNRFRQERSKEKVVTRREPLQYRMLAHAASAMNTEIAGLFVASLDVYGPSTIHGFRRVLADRGVDVSQDAIPFDKIDDMASQLVDFGFVERSEQAGDAQYGLTQVGKGLGVVYAGNAIELSAKYPQRLFDFWYNTRKIDEQETIIETFDGEIHYTRRTAEGRIRVIDAIVQAWARKKLPIGVQELTEEINKEGEVINPNTMPHLVGALAHANIISYRSLTNHLGFDTIYRLLESRPDTPPKPYRKQTVLTKQVDKYMLSHPDTPLTAAEGLIFIRQRFPERYFVDQENLRYKIGTTLNYFTKQGYVEIEGLSNKDKSEIKLNANQRDMLRELIWNLRDVQNRNPLGREKAHAVLANPTRVRQLVKKSLQLSPSQDQEIPA